MIISHTKQVNFWKIPRTGSTTVEVLVRLLAGLDYTQDIVPEMHFFPGASHNFDAMPDSQTGAPGRTRTHVTPEEAIAAGLLTQAQYDSYDNYVMVRDPLEKLISAHTLGFHKKTFDVAQLIPDFIAPNVHFSLFRPQVDWLTLGNINIMPFSDYENSVTTILTAFGAPIPEDIPNITRRHPHADDFTRAQSTPRDRREIEAFYAADSALNF